MATTHIIDVCRPILSLLAEDELVAGVVAQFTRVRHEGIGFGFAKDGEGVAAAFAVAMCVFGGGVFGGAEPDGGAEEGFDAGGVDGDECNEGFADGPDGAGVDAVDASQGEDAAEEGGGRRT